MARSLDQILAELEPGYAGSRKIAQTQLDALPGQFEADLTGMKAQQDEAFTGIVDSARRRGLGFSGIPVGEQAKYNATQFMPAVAKLKGDQLSRRMSLEEVLNSLDREKRGAAMNLQQTELTRDEQSRQFNESQAFERQKLAEAQRSSAAAAARPTLSMPGGGSAASTDPVQQAAYNDVRDRIGGSFDSIVSDYLATLKSANYGNVLDKQKIQIYNQLRPDVASAAQSRGQGLQVTPAASGSWRLM